MCKFSSVLPAPVFEEDIICPDAPATISCPPGKFIDIIAADFGRKDNAECRGDKDADAEELNPDEPCSLDVYDVMREK